MSPLEAALDKLLIADVWRLLGLPGKPPERDKTVQSPFRDDTGTQASRSSPTADAGKITARASTAMRLTF